MTIAAPPSPPTLPVAVGDTVVFSKTVGEFDVYGFAGITGDFSPNHVDEERMRTTRFGGRIAHGALLIGYMSTTSTMLIERGLARDPNWTAVALGYDRIRFVGPVRIGDTVTVRYRITAVDAERGRTTAEITVETQEGALAAVATGLLKWLPLEEPSSGTPDPGTGKTDRTGTTAPATGGVVAAAVSGVTASGATDGHRAAVAALLSTLLPGDDAFPDAANTDTPALFARRVEETDPALAARLRAWLEAGTPPFAARDAAARAEAVAAWERAEPAAFRRLLTIAYLSYYEAPEVVAAIRAIGIPYNDTPQPAGYPLPAFRPEQAPRHGIGGYVPTAAVKRLPLPDFAGSATAGHH